VFDNALKMDPALAEARFNRAVALLKLKEPAKASIEFAQLATNEKTTLRASAAYHNALALDRLGRAADAETWLGRAMELDARFDPAVLYIGVLRERRGDLQGAGRAYLDYLKRNPDSTAAMLRLSVAAQRAGRPDTARTYLKKVIALAPESAEATEARKLLVMWE
jgi:tetratricopeptide (TPR) repeat protein